MGLDRETFAQAVAVQLDPLVAQRLAAAWQTGAPAPADHEKDAGRALAIAFSTLPADEAARTVDSLTLLGVEIAGQDPLWLPAHDAFTHPLLGEWAAATFADALGDCIRGGRLGVNVAPHAPIFSSYDLIEEAGAIRQAIATLIFEGRSGSITARMMYGGRLAGAFGRSAVCNGDALYKVGAALRGASPLATDGDEDGEAPPAPLHPVIH